MLAEIDRISTKEKLYDVMNYEKQLYKGNVLLGILGISEGGILKYHQILLRKTEYYFNRKNKLRYLLYKVLLRRLQNKYSLHIPINCCGKGLKIMHCGSILINEKVTIEGDCALHINTSIIAGGRDSGVPYLSKGVVLGVGAVVLGNVFLAQDISVGANAVVNNSFYEENIAIAGVPAKKISNNGRATWNKK